MHRNSRDLFRIYGVPFITRGARVLEIGPDGNPSSYQALVDAEVDRWDTLDLAERTDIPLTYRAIDEYTFPIEDGSYDVIVAGQVIEHVRKIWRWMPELARICRPGGHIIVINPVSWHYHEAPVDCWRIYPEGMRALCDDAGLDVVLSRFENVQLSALEARAPRIVRKQRVFERMAGLLGMVNATLKVPVEGAWDTITVARRPGG